LNSEAKGKVVSVQTKKIFNRSGGTAPLILNLGMRWRWMVSLTLQLLYLQRQNSGSYWIGGWMGPRGGLYILEQRKPLAPSRIPTSVHQTCRLDTTILSWYVIGHWLFSHFTIFHQLVLSPNYRWDVWRWLWETWEQTSRDSTHCVTNIKTMKPTSLVERQNFIVSVELLSLDYWLQLRSFIFLLSDFISFHFTFHWSYTHMELVLYTFSIINKASVYSA